MERSKKREGRAQQTRASPLILLLGLMIVAGVGLRFLDLGYPERLTWDEHHFVHNARNYLAGQADWNDHPPLGKLLMALSMSRFGDTSFAFRLPSAILGSFSIVAAGALAWGVFRLRLAAYLAAAFIAADGFFISYSRTALLDGMLTMVSLSALFAMTLRGVLAPLLTGVLIGMAMAIKMSGVVLVGPFLALGAARALSSTKFGERFSLSAGETPLFGGPHRVSLAELASYPSAFIVAATVYLGFWMFGLSLAGQEHSISDAVTATQKMMAGHAAATDWEHPLLSRWWTWAVPTKPLVLTRDVTEDGMVRMLATMGNPLLWWSVLGAVGLTLFELARARFRAIPSMLLGRAWLLLGYTAFLTPWIITNRDSYIYHYLPAYSVGMVLLAGTIATILRYRERRLSLTAGAAFVFLVSVHYAPVWAQIPLSPAAVDQRPLVHGTK